MCVALDKARRSMASRSVQASWEVVVVAELFIDAATTRRQMVTDRYD